ncbi:MAG: hypothetical protein JXA67_00030 [Micromonosporaceae bacterium]|nr:hypothetical protein [Micromonosporaceae bacterium]
MPVSTVLVTLGIGTAIGVIVGVPIGRHLERALWHADVAMIHARFLAEALRSVVGRIALVLLVTASLALIGFLLT